jgi:hypothetical protein
MAEEPQKEEQLWMLTPLGRHLLHAFNHLDDVTTRLEDAMKDNIELRSRIEAVTAVHTDLLNAAEEIRVSLLIMEERLLEQEKVCPTSTATTVSPSDT